MVNRDKIFLGFTALVVISVAMMMTDCSRHSNTAEIKIGVIVPLTGGAAEFGKWARNGVELAVGELNQHRNASAPSFIALYEDHQMDVKLGVSAFNKLVDLSRVSAVVTSGSGVVLAIAPEADRTHTLQLNYAAVSPKVCGAGKYTFTLVNSADVETDDIAALAINQLKLNKVAILYANAAYGVTTKDAVVRSFTKAGGQILGTVAFPENFTDLRAQILQLKELKPPAVYFIATIKDSGRLLKQAGELGLKTQWLTYNAFESPEVLQIAGGAADGVIYTSSNLFDLQNPPSKGRAFLESYVSKYGERPNLYSATAYDAVQLLALAESSADRSPEGLQKFLASVRNYPGANGTITFDERGCVHKPVFLKTVRGNHFEVYQGQ